MSDLFGYHIVGFPTRRLREDIIEVRGLVEPLWPDESKRTVIVNRFWKKGEKSHFH